MAESSVQSAVQWLGNLLVQEEENLRAIKEKVEHLRDELDWMHCFLREADESRYMDPRINRWVIQIQEIAYEAEEIVENFLFQFKSHQKQEYGGRTFVIKSKLERLLWVIKEAKAIHDANNDIEALRAKIATLTSRLQAYGIKITRLDSGSLTSSAHLSALDVVKELKVVGLDDQVKKIVGDLVGKGGENRVFGIWGKSGVGKTTLAKDVYFNHAIRKHFDKFSWVYVPKNCKISSVLRGILASLTTKLNDEIGVMNDQLLINEVYEVLIEKKCLVILDNVWNCEIWDGLKAAFPGEDDDDSESKFLFTTEDRQVAEQINEGTIHEIKCLSYDQSWELLQAKLGGILAQTFGNEGISKRTDIAKKMLKFCQGIPLAIIVLGGLLMTKRTPQEWEILLDFMTSQLNGKNYQQQSHEKVMELCYYALPSYLKNCFLHLGSFPQDYEIPTKKLCNIWAAEGIVVLVNEELSRGESLEDFAENCLSELLQRGMIQVSKRKSSNGRVKSCKLHEVMRDLCLKVSKEENFLSIMDCNSNEVLNGKIRRLAMYLGEESKDVLIFQKYPMLRSVLTFPSQREILRLEVNQASVKALCRDSQLLRVLDLEGIVISSKTLPKEIGDLIYLRYLSVREMLLTKLPPTIGCLRWLETLDLRAKVRVEIPNVLWCLERLKNLYLPCYFTIKDSEKLRLDNLKRMLTLKNVNHFLLEDVLAMKKLREASVRYMPENEHIEFIQKSRNVVFSLTIFRAIIGKEQVNVLVKFDNLIKLELKGEVLVPINSLEFPPNLKKLVLDFCGIMQDPMPALEKLPNLTSLCLDHQAYVGEKMICSSSGFSQLTYLRLQGLKSLQDWEVREGAMPNLKYLMVKNCERLTKIPEDLPQNVQITHI